MASDDKKTKTNPVQKDEVPHKKKDEVAPKNKSPSGADLRPTHPQVIVGARAKSRFQKLIRIIGMRFTQGRRRKNDNCINETMSPYLRVKIISVCSNVQPDRYERYALSEKADKI
jgi:hypothetical protein